MLVEPARGPDRDLRRCHHDGPGRPSVYADFVFAPQAGH